MHVSIYFCLIRLSSLLVNNQVSKYKRGDLHKSREREADIPVSPQVASTHSQSVIYHTVDKPVQKWNSFA